MRTNSIAVSRIGRVDLLFIIPEFFSDRLSYTCKNPKIIINNKKKKCVNEIHINILQIFQRI